MNNEYKNELNDEVKKLYSYLDEIKSGFEQLERDVNRGNYDRNSIHLYSNAKNQVTETVKAFNQLTMKKEQAHLKVVKAVTPCLGQLVGLESLINESIYNDGVIDKQEKEIIVKSANDLIHLIEILKDEVINFADTCISDFGE